MTSNPKMLSPSEYVKDTALAIKKAKKRVYFLAMVVADDESSNELIDELIDAAKRSVEVHVAADVMTYIELGGTFLPSAYSNKKARAATSMSKELSNSGATFHWLGRKNSTILSGRTHTKLCVVDNTVYSFGGVNLYNGGIASSDYMFKITDKNLSDRLADEFIRLTKAEQKNEHYKSHSFAWGDNHVLVDGGIMGNSIIYSRACMLARQASKITYVSQYCPSNKLSSLIKKTDHTIYFNPPSNANLYNKAFITMNMMLSGLKTSYTKQTYLHAKFIIFENLDGTKTAITGSHNFAYAGVFFGTREIALETRDPDIIKQLEEFVANNLV